MEPKGNEDVESELKRVEDDLHTISDFTYGSNDLDLMGLFGHVSYGEIKNLGSINPNIDARGCVYIGALVGYADDRVTIRECYAKGGSVTGCEVVVGFVGRIAARYAGIVTKCYASVAVAAEDKIGGLVGKNTDRGIVENCYATGSVESVGYAGGLLGCLSHGGNICNCYASGSVVTAAGDSHAYGLAGRGPISPIVIGYVYDSYWDIQTTKTGYGCEFARVRNVEGLTTAEMQQRASFTN